MKEPHCFFDRLAETISYEQEDCGNSREEMGRGWRSVAKDRQANTHCPLICFLVHTSKLTHHKKQELKVVDSDN